MQFSKFHTEHVSIECWALRGYPLKPQRVTVVKVEPADRYTEAYCTLSDGSRIQRSLCYEKRPRQVKVTDAYGTMTKWQGKQL